MSFCVMKPCSPLEATHLRIIAEPPMGGVTYHPLERDENGNIAGVYFESFYSPMNIVELTAHHGVNCWFTDKEELPVPPRIEYDVTLYPGEQLTLKVGNDIRGVYQPGPGTEYRVIIEPVEL